MNYNISLIPGDGIGPEIVAEAKKVLDKICEKYGHTFSYPEVLLGGASIDVHGVPLTDEAIATAKASDAVLMGSIGGDAARHPHGISWSHPNARRQDFLPFVRH